jgi:hypothetical protein
MRKSAHRRGFFVRALDHGLLFGLVLGFPNLESSRFFGGIASIFFASLLSSTSSGSAMANTLKPGLLRICPQQTPSPNDPPEAPKFYLALGIAVVAWGRLEGLFLANLMMVIQIGKDKGIGPKLPMKWEKQKCTRNHAFDAPLLLPHKETATKIIAEFDDLSGDRTLIAHSLWERFIPRPPLGIEMLKMKAAKRNQVEFVRTIVDLDWLATFTGRVNQLNISLAQLAEALSPLQGRPPSNVRIF